MPYKTNNEKFSDLLSQVALPMPVAMTLFNRGLGTQALSESQWKAFTAEPAATNFLPLSDDLLAHAERIFGAL